MTDLEKAKRLLGEALEHIRTYIRKGRVLQAEDCITEALSLLEKVEDFNERITILEKRWDRLDRRSMERKMQDQINKLRCEIEKLRIRLMHREPPAEEPKRFYCPVKKRDVTSSTCDDCDLVAVCGHRDGSENCEKCHPTEPPAEETWKEVDE